MPRLGKYLLMKYLLMVTNQSRNLVQLMFGKTAIGSHTEGFKPELRNLPVSLDMDVKRLSTIRAKKHEIIRAIAEYRRH